MRTTLTLDDDVLEAAKAIARQSQRSVGDVVSDLARRALRRSPPETRRNGIPLLSTPGEGKIVTQDIVNGLRDELP